MLTPMEPTSRPFNEPLRPQFHFTAPRNWLNDPNGCLFDGTHYHLFYQHDPDAMRSAGQNMHWGHAISTDLLHWQHLPIAIPNREPHQAWSGSAILDEKNLLGVRRPDGPVPILAFYSRIGEGQTLAFSNDGGVTFRDFSVILPHTRTFVQNPHRDPKVFYHAPTERYVLILWEDTGYAFYSSSDLRQWKRESFLDGYYECPDLLEVPVDGTNEKRWTLFDGTGSYVTGDFDGRTFTPTSPKLILDHGPHFYATQTFYNTPSAAPPVQIAWMRGGQYPGAPFSQQMTFPRQLTLRRYGSSLRVHQSPIPALDTLVTETSRPKLASRKPVPIPELARLSFTFSPSAPIHLRIAGNLLSLWPSYQVATFAGCTAHDPFEQPIRLTVLVDRSSIEIFLSDGLTTFSLARPVTDRTLALESKSGAVLSATVETLRSTWE